MIDFNGFPKREICACCGRDRKLKEPFHKVLGYDYMEFKVCRICLNLIRAEKDAILRKDFRAAKDYRTEIGVRMRTNKRSNPKEFSRWYLDYMKDKVKLVLDDEINSFLAKEALSDVSTFLDDPEQYLVINHRENKMRFGKAAYTSSIDVGGELYNSVERVCKELRSVNCYQEAIELYQNLICRLQDFLTEPISKEDKDNIEFTINEFKSELLNVMKDRDEYISKRNSILGKYSLLFQNN